MKNQPTPQDNQTESSPSLQTEADDLGQFWANALRKKVTEWPKLTQEEAENPPNNFDGAWSQCVNLPETE